MDSETWIRNRAYALFEFRRALKLPNDPVQDWLDAEWEYHTFYERRIHAENFAKRMNVDQWN